MRDRILKAHLTVILRQACTYVGRGLDLADLFQEGCNGFVVGLDRFRFDKGATFRNYIGFWIRQAILRAIATKARTIRLPVHVHEALGECDSVEQDTLEDLEENFDDARDHAKEDEEQTKHCVTNLQRVGINEITEIELHHAIGELADTEDRTAGQELDRTATKIALDRLLLELDQREQNVVARRFGLGGRKIETLEQIAVDYRLTRERIRQIEKNAIEKLRHPSCVMQLLGDVGVPHVQASPIP